MATSISLSNFFSFLISSPSPPPQPKAPPHHLSLSSHASANRHEQKLSPNSSLLVSKASQENWNDSSSQMSTELASVICPSLAHANTMFFKSAYNVQIIVDDNEPEERLLNRFRREVMRAGVIQECKRRRFYENTQDKEKRKSREAAKRNRRRRPQSRNFSQNKPEATTKKKDDDDGDNWELPEGDLPY